MNKCWVARCSILFGEKDLSPKFDSAMECQEYIDTKLCILHWLVQRIAYQLHENRIDIDIKLNDYCGGIQYIRSYNINDNRYCGSFDF